MKKYACLWITGKEECSREEAISYLLGVAIVIALLLSIIVVSADSWYLKAEFTREVYEYPEPVIIVFDSYPYGLVVTYAVYIDDRLIDIGQINLTKKTTKTILVPELPPGKYLLRLVAKAYFNSELIGEVNDTALYTVPPSTTTVTVTNTTTITVTVTNTTTVTTTLYNTTTVTETLPPETMTVTVYNNTTVTEIVTTTLPTTVTRSTTFTKLMTTVVVVTSTRVSFITNTMTTTVTDTTTLTATKTTTHTRTVLVADVATRVTYLVMGIIAGMVVLWFLRRRG